MQCIEHREHKIYGNCLWKLLFRNSDADGQVQIHEMPVTLFPKYMTDQGNMQKNTKGGFL